MKRKRTPQRARIDLGAASVQTRGPMGWLVDVVGRQF